MQGGMGVGVSLSGLAGAVARSGGIGIISAAQIGYREPDYDRDPHGSNLKALRQEIRKAKEMAEGGIIGVNIMLVTTGYDDYVKTAVAAGADLIVTGAGLPMNLPALVEGSEVKIAPIVSSVRATKVILAYWKKHYNRIPDLLVIEGPKAGGHLGFSKQEVPGITREEYDKEVQGIISLCTQSQIPVFVAGGIYTREDMEHYRAMGAFGVQMATRFVTTYECDAHENYKKAYLNAREEDVIITDSPVGLPGRALNNEFLKRVAKGERFMGKCRRCVMTCKPAETPYCISRALIQAVSGNCEEGLIFVGSNVYRTKELEHVADIMEEFRV